jgi:hypothetical protein
MDLDRRRFITGMTAVAGLSATPVLAQPMRPPEPQRYPDPAWKVLDKRFNKYMIGNAALLH